MEVSRWQGSRAARGYAVWVAIAVVVGFACGEVLRRRLNRLAYRRTTTGDDTTTTEHDDTAPTTEHPHTDPTTEHTTEHTHTDPTEHDHTDPTTEHDDTNPTTEHTHTATTEHDDTNPPDEPPSSDRTSPRADPAETDLPDPGRRRWIPFTLATAWAATVWASSTTPDWASSTTPDWAALTTSAWATLTTTPDLATPQAWARLIGWLAFTTIGLWLAVIDLDVQRLPDIGQLALAAALVPAGIVVAWPHPSRLAVGLAAAAVCAVAFLLLNIISKGGLGLGDVKLIATCGWWLGITSLTAVYAAVAAACLLAVIYSAITRSRRFAFGPWLIAGTLIAGLTVT